LKWIQRKAKKSISNVKKDDYFEQLARIRGIKDLNEYLNPDSNVLNDGSKMKNVKEANQKILDAIYEGKKIAVSYDADADGVMSGTLMMRFLRFFTQNVYFLYSQKEDGHGVDFQLDQIQDDTDLVIVVDSSSNSIEASREIVEDMGIDLIIFDHHRIENENPYALIVNPQQKGDKYHNKYLSGVGVVFKSIELIQDDLNEAYGSRFDVWDYTDIVAVGMRADEMDMSVLENRYLVMHGLDNIRTLGIERILKGANIRDFNNLNSDVISFTIAPMINGAIRMGQIELPIELMLTDDDKIAKKLRLQMQKLNDERKSLQSIAVEKHSKNIDLEQKIIVVVDDESNNGFNGIVAQQLSSKYHRPALVMRRGAGKISGSGRSFAGFKMLSFLNSIDGVTARGHEGAMGCEFHEDDLEYFKAYIDLNMDEIEEKEPIVMYDLELDAEEVKQAIGTVEKFNRVYGQNSPKAYVRVNNIMIEEVKTIGKTAETRKFETMNDMLGLIKFRVNEEYGSELDIMDEINAVGSIAVNKFFNFQSRKWSITNQLMIEDYKKLN